MGVEATQGAYTMNNKGTLTRGDRLSEVGNTVFYFVIFWLIALAFAVIATGCDGQPIMAIPIALAAGCAFLPFAILRWDRVPG